MAITNSLYHSTPEFSVLSGSSAAVKQITGSALPTITYYSFYNNNFHMDLYSERYK